MDEENEEEQQKVRKEFMETYREEKGGGCGETYATFKKMVEEQKKIARSEHFMMEQNIDDEELDARFNELSEYERMKDRNAGVVEEFVRRKAIDRFVDAIREGTHEMVYNQITQFTDGSYHWENQDGPGEDFLKFFGLI